MATKKRVSAKKKSVAKKGTARLSRTKLGLKKLSQEADKMIGEECGEIVTALRNNAKKGSIGSAKLLVQLAGREDAEDGEAETGEQRESLSSWLVTQQEWPGFPMAAKKDAK